MNEPSSECVPYQLGVHGVGSGFERRDVPCRRKKELLGGSAVSRGRIFLLSLSVIV